MKIFFGKISPKIEPKQLSEGYYRSEKGSSWFNGIDVGDYCFMIGANKIQLWKAKEWTIKKERSVGVKTEAPNEILKFDILIDDLKIDTAKLTSFIYLKLSMHLIIFSVRSAGSSQKAFFPLQISPKLTEEMLINVETYKNSNNYRKTWIFPTKDKLKNDSEDIQLYLENNEWKIQEPSFVDGHPFEDFKDNLFFSYTVDNYFAEAVETEIWQARFNNLNTAFPFLGQLFGADFIYEKVLHVTEEEAVILTAAT